MLLKRETAQEGIWTRQKTPFTAKKMVFSCVEDLNVADLLLWEGRRKEGGSNYYNKK